MFALLTYRSRNSFESRFGRKVPDPYDIHTLNKTNFDRRHIQIPLQLLRN